MSIGQGNLTISTVIQDVKATGLGRYTGSPQIIVSESFTSGLVYTAQVTGPGVTTIDVTNLEDEFGDPISFSVVSSITVQNAGAATVVIGGGSNALFGTDSYSVMTGKAMAAQTAVNVSGSAKNLVLTPAATTTVNLIITGT